MRRSDGTWRRYVHVLLVAALHVVASPVEVRAQQPANADVGALRLPPISPASPARIQSPEPAEPLKPWSPPEKEPPSKIPVRVGYDTGLPSLKSYELQSLDAMFGADAPIGGEYLFYVDPRAGVSLKPFAKVPGFAGPAGPTRESYSWAFGSKAGYASRRFLDDVAPKACGNDPFGRYAVAFDLAGYRAGWINTDDDGDDDVAASPALVTQGSGECDPRHAWMRALDQANRAYGASLYQLAYLPSDRLVLDEASSAPVKSDGKARPSSKGGKVRPIDYRANDLAEIRRRLPRPAINYNKPKELEFGKDTEIALIVESFSAKAATEAMRLYLGDKVRKEGIPLAPLVEVKLSGPPGDVLITPRGESVQELNTLANTKWSWYVKPLRPGTTTLTLEVWTTVSTDEGEHTANMQTFQDTIPVRVSFLQWLTYHLEKIDPVWKWLVGAGTALGGVLTAFGLLKGGRGDGPGPTARATKPVFRWRPDRN